MPASAGIFSSSCKELLRGSSFFFFGFLGGSSFFSLGCFGGSSFFGLGSLGIYFSG